MAAAQKPPPASAASDAGWYIGRIVTSSVASAKGGTSPEVQDTVFQWANATARPTVTTANITNLTAITGGPYPTQAAATKAAEGDKNTTTGQPGTGPAPPPVTTSTVGSSNGSIPNPLSGLAAIGAFFNNLGNPNLWLRVAKVVTGSVMIIVGLARITGTDKAITTVAKGALP
jgi:hypothetical protein